MKSSVCLLVLWTSLLALVAGFTPEGELLLLSSNRVLLHRTLPKLIHKTQTTKYSASKTKSDVPRDPTPHSMTFSASNPRPLKKISRKRPAKSPAFSTLTKRNRPSLPNTTPNEIIRSLETKRNQVCTPTNLPAMPRSKKPSSSPMTAIVGSL